MRLDFISPNGSILPLVGNSKFKITNIDGMTTASAELATSTVTNMDGDILNNKRAMPRSIVFDIAIENEVEATKRYILKYVKFKQKGTLRWTQDDREVEIEGIVESIDMPRWTNSTAMQFTLYCSQPYWQDVNFIVQEISAVLDLHYFTNYENDMLYFTEEGQPFGEYDINKTKVFNNDGDVDVGIEIHIVALGSVTNPIIYNSRGEFIGVDVELNAGDEILITTEKGNKKISLNGQNIISKIKEQSTWLQLPTGEEEFTIDSESGEDNMYFTIIYKQRYC